MKAIMGLVGASIVLGGIGAAHAAPPQQIHWQGFLTDTTGAPLHCPAPADCPSGEINIVFRLYHQPAGGQAFWSETFSDVPAHQGAIHVVLGDEEPIRVEDLAQDTWLGVEVNLYGELAPRQRFVSSPYALWSAHANTAGDAASLGGVPAADYVLASDLLAASYIDADELAAALAGYVTHAGLAALDYIDATELASRDFVNGARLEQRLAGVVAGNQGCAAGSVVTGFTATGAVVCGVNVDALVQRITALEQKVAAEKVPAGTVLPFAGSLSSVPAGWLPCDGRALAPGLYPELFAAIGTAHGGNGFDNFYLPDYQGRFLRGVDSGRNRDRDATSRYAEVAGGNTGDRVGSLQERATGMPGNAFATTSDGSHSHSLTDAFYAEQWCGGDYVGTGSGDSDNDNRLCTRGIATADAGSHNHAVVGGDSETRPVNAAVHFIIKTGR